MEGGWRYSAAAGKVPSSQAGKRAARVGGAAGGAVAGALFGLVGAPIIGAACAVMANKGLSGEVQNMSPQTSDDESEPGIMSELIKNSKNMANDLYEEDTKKK